MKNIAIIILILLVFGLYYYTTETKEMMKISGFVAKETFNLLSKTKPVKELKEVINEEILKQD